MNTLVTKSLICISCNHVISPPKKKLISVRTFNFEHITVISHDRDPETLHNWIRQGMHYVLMFRVCLCATLHRKHALHYLVISILVRYSSFPMRFRGVSNNCGCPDIFIDNGIGALPRRFHELGNDSGCASGSVANYSRISSLCHFPEIICISGTTGVLLRCF